MGSMTTSTQIPPIELPLSDDDIEPAQGETEGTSSTSDLLRGLSLGVGALVSVHLVWQIALLGLRLLGLLP